MKKAAIILAALALSGCATRFVRVPCLSQQQYDERAHAEPPKIHNELTGDAAKDIKPIASSAVLLRSWGKGNLDILGSCVG